MRNRVRSQRALALAVSMEANERIGFAGRALALTVDGDIECHQAQRQNKAFESFRNIDLRCPDQNAPRILYDMVADSAESKQQNAKACPGRQFQADGLDGVSRRVFADGAGRVLAGDRDTPAVVALPESRAHYIDAAARPDEVSACSTISFLAAVLGPSSHLGLRLPKYLLQ